MLRRLLVRLAAVLNCRGGWTSASSRRVRAAVLRRCSAVAVRGTVLLGVLLASCPFAFALDPALTISQDAHTAYQTTWFRSASVAAVLALFVAAYWFRVRQIARNFNLRLDERVNERTRIARELHDTLLQTFQGVLIHFQAATNLLPGRPDEAKRKFEKALDEAGLAITEGREAAQAMRESAAHSTDLPEALSQLADQLTSDVDPARAPTIRMHVEGSPRSLHATVRDDVYRIASEALRNAVRHARAQLIQVNIHYDDRYLQLRVRDDGTGIDAAILERDGVSGNWGLPGMREQTELIGGTLDVRSRLGAGTEVELSLPAAKAYVVSEGRRHFWSQHHNTEERS